jgi:hypothetical protein
VRLSGQQLGPTAVFRRWRGLTVVENFTLLIDFFQLLKTERKNLRLTNDAYLTSATAIHGLFAASPQGGWLKSLLSRQMIKL